MSNHKLRLAPVFGIATLSTAALIVPATAAPSPTAAGTVASSPVVASTVAASTVAARVPSWPSVAQLMPSSMQVSPVKSTDRLNSRIKRRLSRQVRKAPLGRNVAMRVEDLATGRKIYGKRAKRPMVPASSMKLATALATLSAYGSDHILPTAVSRAPASRVIVIRGGGDPLLSSADIDALAHTTAEQVRSEGLPERKLLVRYDTSLFAPATLPAGWPQYYFYNYAAKPNALMRDRRMVADPAHDAAVYFRQRLRFHGLKGHVGAKVKPRSVPAGAIELASNTSHTVGDAMWRMLLYSDNTVAEVMIRHVALSQGRPTTPTGSANAVRAELASLRIPLKNASFHDGSGLSTRNKLPGRTLTGIVRASVDPNRPELSSPYRWFSVPVAGRSGTLRSRFHAKRTKCAIGLVMAKTGSLSGVISLSGVAAGNDGRHRAFSIVVNDRPRNSSVSATRYRVDRLAATLTGCS